jgi:hypothetical protein
MYEMYSMGLWPLRISMTQRGKYKYLKKDISVDSDMIILEYLLFQLLFLPFFSLKVLVLSTLLIQLFSPVYMQVSQLKNQIYAEMVPTCNTRSQKKAYKMLVSSPVSTTPPRTLLVCL